MGLLESFDKYCVGFTQKRCFISTLIHGKNFKTKPEFALISHPSIAAFFAKYKINKRSRAQAAILRGNIEETEQQKQEEEHIAKSLKQNVEKLSKVENLENLRVLY